MKTITLAHYYAPEEVKAIADRVGDSLDLSRFAAENEAEQIVFAGVEFMAESAKLLNPNAKVILPDQGSTCSLVTMTEKAGFNGNTIFEEIDLFRKAEVKPTRVITYINSSVRLKSVSDIIVTSANVEDVVENSIAAGYAVYFTPDRNMGAYLQFQHPEWQGLFYYYADAVCEVHDKFKAHELKTMMSGWTNYGTSLLAHPESPLPVLRLADYVGSTRGMLNWIRDYKYEYGRVFVATEEGLLEDMRKLKPKLDIQLAPTYTGCQCNACPYMKLNTLEAVRNAQNGIGHVIEIEEYLRLKAKAPLDFMLSEKWRILAK